jgi:hypothetical protein
MLLSSMVTEKVEGVKATVAPGGGPRF